MELINKIVEDDLKAKSSIQVEKIIPLKFDLGTLLAVDENQLELDG